MKKILLAILLAAAMPLVAADEFCVKTINGVPIILLNGKPFSQRMYMANPMHLPSAKLAVDTGAYIQQIVDYFVVWEGQPESNFAEFDAYMDKVLAVDPRIRIIPRMKLDDRQPPFLKDHPSHLMRLENGGTVKHFDPKNEVGSIASPIYREEMKKALRRTIRHLEEKYGDRMAGYMPVYGNGSEWQYWRFAMQDMLNGYDVCTKRAFREWLKRKYKTDAALQEAWNNATVTLKTANVPTVAERRGKESFLDPKNARNVVDFNFFQNENMVEALLECAKVVREVCGHRKLSCTYYGYTFECAAVWRNGPSVSGHFALKKLLDSPDIDIVAGPFSYALDIRSLGGGCATHTVSESITQAGKLWLNEDDNATHIAVPEFIAKGTAPDGALHALRTLDESLKIYRRNLAFGMIRNHAVWWMDLYGKQWQNDPALWDEMRRFFPLEKKLQDELAPYVPDIALIADENSLHFCSSSMTPFRMLKFGNYIIRSTVSRTAVTYGSYLLADVLDGKVPDSKLDVYCGCFALTGAQRAALRERAKTRPALWIWAPGYIDLDKNEKSLAAMRDLTGFEFVKAKTENLVCNATGVGMIYGLPSEIGHYSCKELIGVKPEKSDIVLARFTDGNAAIVIRPPRDGQAAVMFCGTNDLPPTALRLFAKYSKATIWCDEDLHVQARGRFAAFTAPHAGAFAIKTPFKGVLYDALSGEKISDSPEFIRKFELGDTLVIESRVH